MEQLNHVAAQVRDIIVSRIESHEYLPGEMIPSERVLAEMYGVSRPTIRTAIDELVNEHYLVRRQGKGTFVRKPEYNKVAFGVLNESENASFTSLVRNFGIEISNKLLCTGTIQGRYYYADKLGLAFEEPIYGIHRIRQGNKEPLAIEYTYVPLKFFPDHLPVVFQESLTMVEAGDKIRSYLHLEDEMIVNHLELIGYDHHGNLVEYTESYSRPDKLEVRFVSNNTK